MSIRNGGAAGQKKRGKAREAEERDGVNRVPAVFQSERERLLGGTWKEPERRVRPRPGRPVIPAKERELGKGWWLTVDSWPAEMLWPVTRPKRYEQNPRRNADAVADVVLSLKEFGARQPIVVDEHEEIVVGDTRYLGVLQLGWPRYPVHQAFRLTPAQIKAYRIADNKVGERAEWDFPRLKAEFEGLQGLGFDLSLTGFQDYELPALLGGGTGPVGTQDQSEVWGGMPEYDGGQNISWKAITVHFKNEEDYRQFMLAVAQDATMTVQTRAIWFPYVPPEKFPTLAPTSAP